MAAGLGQLALIQAVRAVVNQPLLVEQARLERQDKATMVGPLLHLVLGGIKLVAAAAGRVLLARRVLQMAQTVRVVVVALVCVALLQVSEFFMLVVALLVVILQVNPALAEVVKAVLTEALQPPVKRIQAAVEAQIIIFILARQAALAS